MAAAKVRIDHIFVIMYNEYNSKEWPDIPGTYPIGSMTGWHRIRLSTVTKDKACPLLLICHCAHDGWFNNWLVGLNPPATERLRQFSSLFQNDCRQIAFLDSLLSSAPFCLPQLSMTPSISSRLRFLLFDAGQRTTAFSRSSIINQSNSYSSYS